MIGMENICPWNRKRVSSYIIYISLRKTLCDRFRTPSHIWLQSPYALNNAVSFSYATYTYEHNLSLMAVYILFSYSIFTGELSLFSFVYRKQIFVKRNYMDKICMILLVSLKSCIYLQLLFSILWINTC